MVVTKFPEAILAEPVRRTLARYDLVVAQVTITGLGGTPLEPRVPPAEAALAALPRLIDFLGSPERLAVRIDPIVHWREGSSGTGAGASGGDLRTNLGLFGDIAQRARAAGVTLVKTSLTSPYPKAIRRFREAGLELASPQGEERRRILDELDRQAAAAGVTLHYCCEPARPRAACVDAALLTRLHPRGLPARPDRAAGQREHCGCSRSTDLAWYSSHPCPSGCLYCYANPVGHPGGGKPAGSPDGGSPAGGASGGVRP